MNEINDNQIERNRGGSHDEPKTPRRRRDDSASARRAERRSATEGREPARRRRDDSASVRQGERRSGAEGREPARRRRDDSGEVTRRRPRAEETKPARRPERRTVQERTERRAAVPSEASEPRKRRRSAGKARHSQAANRTAAIVALSVLALLVVGVTVGVSTFGVKLRDGSTIFPNVNVGEIAVGGMTEAEAEALLDEKGWNERVGGTLTIRFPMGVKTELDYIRAGNSLTAAQAAEAAYAFGHSGSALDSLMAYLGNLIRPVDVSGTATVLDTAYISDTVGRAVSAFEDSMHRDKEYTLSTKSGLMTFFKGANVATYDVDTLAASAAEALRARETVLEIPLPTTEIPMPDFEAIHESLMVEPADAYYDKELGEVVPEQVGANFDVANARLLWEQTPVCQEVDIPVAFTLPNETKEHLESLLFRDKLGDCDTAFWGSSDNRIISIDLVAQKLNGMVMMPGESFSYNGYVGERTEAAGFRAAPAYADGAVTYEVGGGICQVSSTLYNAVLEANLKIDTRTCHYFTVGYLPLGLDATVSFPRPDFGFTNNRDYPIMVKAWTDRDKMTLYIEVWGSNLDGTYVQMRHAQWQTYDPDYPEVQIGWGASSWRQIFDAEGNMIDEIREAYSDYHLHDEDIHYPESASVVIGDAG